MYEDTTNTFSRGAMTTPRTEIIHPEVRQECSLSKMAVFWVVAPCSLVEVARKVEAVRSSETAVNVYQTTRRCNPEDNHLRTYRREDLKTLFSIIYAFNIYIDASAQK
jgi:hypothetical protein